MATNDIKQRIVLEGEKEYNAALAEAKRNLKTLRSELKAETAELGANATAQQKNEAKVKSLQTQIKEQEKIVKTYQAALKEVKEKYGDNAEAVAKWEVKLNDARTTLANMKNSLDDVGQGFKNIENSASMATVASKSVADALGNLSGIGEAISDSIEAAFTGLLGKTKEVVSAVWGEIVDLAARSNNLVDLAGFWNTDVNTIQKYAGAVANVSGSLEDLNSLVTKINAGDSKKIAELTGVSSENYQDQWQYAMAVMDAMSKMDKQARNNAAFDIFGGKQATKAFDLLNDWEALVANLGKYDAEQGGFGPKAEDIKKMSDLYDLVNGVRESWNRLKDMAVINLFGDLAFNITSNAQNILDALLKYMNAGSDAEREEAIKSIEENILAMFEAAKKAIEDGIALLDTIAEDLKKSDNPTAQALGNLLSGLVDALQWLTEDNMANVVKALEVLAAFWLTGKGFAMGTKILEIVKNINLIKAFGVGSGAASGVGSGLGSGITGAGVGIGAGAAAAKALPQIQLGAGNAVPVGDWFTHNTPLGRQATNLIMGALGLAKPFADEDVLAGIKQNIKTIGSDWDSNVITQAGKNSILYWDMINKWQVQAEEYAQQQAELEQQRLEELQRKTEPTENWEFGDDWSMDEILQWVDRQNTQRKDGGNAGNQDGLTAADAHSMTEAVNKMPSAVAKSVGGLRVVMDGQTVGHIVAPYVSAAIATGIL